MIYSVSYRLLGNESDASDLTQDVFLSALKEYRTFKSKSLISTWLYQIAVNKGINICSRKKKIKFFSIDNKIETEEKLNKRGTC